MAEKTESFNINYYMNKMEFKFHNVTKIAVKFPKVEDISTIENFWDIMPQLMLKSIMSSNPESRALQFVDYKSIRRYSHQKITFLNPMDVFIYIFLICHPLLRQIIICQVSKCQLSLPFVAKDPRVTKPILFSFAYNSLIKSYFTPDGTINNFHVSDKKLNIISFIRIGRCPNSFKSKLLNEILEFKHHCFFNKDSNGSCANRLLYEGTIEMNWYLPGNLTNKKFKHPLTFFNLRGNAFDFSEQTKFIFEISTMVGIILTFEEILENEKEELCKVIGKYSDKTCLIFTDGIQFDSDICQFAETLPQFDKNDRNTIVEENLSSIVSEVSQSINLMVTKCSVSNKLSLMDCKIIIKKEHINILFEEELINKKLHDNIRKILNFRDDILSKASSNLFYEHYLPLQALGWKQYAYVDKKRIQKYTEGNILNTTEGWCEIKLEAKAARYSQLGCLKQSEIALRQCHVLISHSRDADDALYMFTLLRIELEKISINFPESKSLSVQNIVRELAQFYELNRHFSTNSNLEEQNKDININYKFLPTLFAKLLLLSEPIEIFDGEVQHIPFIWLNAVLKALSNEIGADKRIFVLGVLGVQSSGKSTLLNTMFGFQFPVSSGRCTRGVSMQLIAVDDQSSIILNYDYLVVLDSEGLRSIEDNNEDMTSHDNELATFIVGVSDLTIVNIKGENFVDLQDIFQIIIIALMKLSSCYFKPKCLFVHQNVDPSAKEKLQSGYKIFLSKLDNATQLISIETKCVQNFTKFTDIIEFDIDHSIYYFPSLHSKPPPMSIVSEDYVIAADKLKKDIIYAHNLNPLIMHLQEWNTKIKTVWKSIQKENFVFCYKNIMERIYYNELDNALHQWSQNYSCEVEKFFLEIKDQILKDKDDEKKTNSEYESQLREKCAIILESDVKEFKDYYFVKHKEYKIFSQWNTHADIHFKNTRSDYERKLLSKLDNIIETAQKNRPHLNSFYEKREVILARAKKAKFEHMFQPVKEQVKDKEFFEEFFEGEWQSWLKGINLTDQESPCINLLLLLKKEIEQLASELNATFEEISIIKSFFQLFKDNSDLPDTFFIGTKHYLLFDQLGRKINYTRQYSCWIDFAKNKQVSNSARPITKGNNMFLKISVIQKKISKQCRDYIQVVKNHEFSITFYKSIIMTIIDSVTEFNDKEGTNNIDKSRAQIENMFIFEIAIFFCAKLITSIKESRLSNQMDSLKMQLKSVFTNFYNEDNFSASMACANGLATILVEKMHFYFADTLQFVQLDNFNFSNPLLAPSKCLLQTNILSDLAERYSFERYIYYIQSPNDAIKDWIVEQYKNFCKSDLSITCTYNFIKINTEVHFQTYANALCKSLKSIDYISSSEKENTATNEGTCFINPNWKTQLVTLLDGKHTRKFQLSDLDALIIEPHEITNPDQFVLFFKDSLIKQSEMFNIHAWIDKHLIIDISCDIICRNLFHCNELCPLCNEPCLSTVNYPEHKHDCGSFHRPLGINGWYKKDTEVFIGYDCKNLTPSVQSSLMNKKMTIDACIKDNQGWNNISKHYMIESVYWEWVMCQFKEQFAAHYGYKINENAINAWSNLTYSEVLDSLQQQMNDYHSPSFAWRTKKKIRHFFSKKKY